MALLDKGVPILLALARAFMVKEKRRSFGFVRSIVLVQAKRRKEEKKARF